MKRVAVMLCIAVWLSACGPTADPVVVATAPAQGGALAVTTEPAPTNPVAGQPSPAAVTQGEIAVSDEGYAHVEVGSEITYQHYPPASGPHYPVTIQYGLYEEDVPEGYWVHMLEHGAIVVLYKCETPCPDLVQSLGDMLDSFPLTKWNNRKIVIVPYQRMSTPLMAVAWDVQMPLDRFDAQALIDFYARHVDQGLEDVP
ncbi:MAG TPA: DUF3105 domain-containing protein [Anaerolineae bacterium]